MKSTFWVPVLLAGLCGVTLATAETVEVTADGSASSSLTLTGELSVPRAAHQATMLPSGEILITGGCSGSCDVSHRSTELYLPAARMFRPGAEMAVARDSHAALQLLDRRVLVVGGWSERQATNSAEVYEPEANRFVTTGSMAISRAAPSATLLPDGRVLVSGGQNSGLEPLASTELFDPDSLSFSIAAPMSVARISHVAVSLADGRVLVIGGRKARRGEILNSAEIFDPSTGQFQATGDMAWPRHKHAAVLLPDGRVLVIGGSDIRDQRGRYQSTEVYDPKTGTFSAGPDMQWPRFKLPHAVAVLPSGAVIVAGGAPQMELYDPNTDSFVTIPGELRDAMEFATASILPTGEVLFVGGYDHDIRTSSSAWLVRNPH